jgi:cysteinyl-tRNA synthetase
MSLFSFFKKEPQITAPLRFRNTLSGVEEVFVPLQNREVRMYNCGPTVYDFQHIGNLRPYVFADVLRRALMLWGYQVKQVINITDVGHLVSDADEGEDKMEKGAKARGQTVEELVQEITEAYFADLDALGINRRTITFPRATQYIGEQIALVQALEEKGYTYRIEDGIYFDTSKFKEYGKLGHTRLEGLQEGARIGETAGKRNPADFALWKFSPKDERRQQEWDSPWGVGFPGWHLECTAMIFKLLGRQIDIHTGGIDHIPVHHNNEIAQAEGATGKQYVKYWMHNAFITIEGKKISKSLGNTIYLRGLMERGFNPLSYRYLLLTAHYRSPINFTWSALEAAQTALTRLQRIFFEDLPKKGEATKIFIEDFTEAIGNDLDTPAALALLWDTLRDPLVTPAQKRGNLLFADKVLGLGLNRKPTASKTLSVLPVASLPEHIRERVQEREVARKNKDYTESDRLRDELKSEGYEIEDKPGGPSVRKL